MKLVKSAATAGITSGIGTMEPVAMNARLTDITSAMRLVWSIGASTGRKKRGKNMSDLIDRQAAIITLEANKRSNEKKGQILCADEDAIIKWLKRLPSAEPERTEKRTERHECVLISRQAASEPKAVNYISTGYADGQPVYDEAECPCCGRIYEEGDMAWHRARYCMDCGQPLLWQEEEEE